MKYFKTRLEFLLEANEAEADPKQMWKDVLKNKKSFIEHYKDLLVAHKKAESKNILNDKLLNDYKQIFLKLCVSYKIGDLNTLKQYSKKFETNFLGKDVKSQNEFYVKYFEQEGVKNLQDLLAKTLEAVPPAEKTTVSNEIKAKQEDVASSTTQPKFVISDEDKKMLMTPKGLQTIIFGREVVNNQGLVKFIQKFLTTGETTGVLTSKTDEAIKKYQQLKGLEPDGKIGPKTWTAIFNDCGVEYNESYFNPLKNSSSVVKSKTPTNKGVVDLKIAKKDQSITQLSSILESITSFDGLEMVIVRPYKEDTKDIVVQFKKDGKVLSYKGVGGGEMVKMSLDKSGKIPKWLQTTLLKDLSITDTTLKVPTDTTTSSDTTDANQLKQDNTLSDKDTDKITVDELDEIIESVRDIIADSNVYRLKTEIKNLFNSNGKSKTFITHKGTKVSAYNMFKKRYPEFVTELNSLGGTMNNKNNKVKTMYSEFIDSLIELGETKKDWNGYDPDLY